MIEIATPGEAKQIIAGLEYVCHDSTSPKIKSASRTLEIGRGQCLEGAFAAAYLMEQLKHPPIILYLQGIKKPQETTFNHVVYAYRDEGFRTIGHSRYPDTGTIDAVFSGPDEAVVEYAKRGWSYFIHIHGWGLIDLSTLDGWRDSPDNLSMPFMEHVAEFEFVKTTKPL